jgi:Flp pilus assembly protein CpaB
MFFMIKYLVTIAGIMVLSFGCVSICSAGNESPKVKALAETTLVKLGLDPVIVAAVKAENGKRKTQIGRAHV